MTEKFYSVQNTPNTVSADRDPDERGFLGTVIQSGKPVIDYEFQLFWDIQANLREIVRRRQLPSGFLKGQARKDSYLDFSFDLPTDPGFTNNTLHMARQTAIVAGMPVVLEYTNTATAGDNLIQLSAPPVLGGPPPDVKRTDFVFLEVWMALVGTSPRSQGSVTVDVALPSDGDTVTINGNPLTARAGLPGVDEFQIGANEVLTAANMAVAVNDVANSYYGDVAASANGNVVTLTAQTPGAVGNTLTLATLVPAVLIISGPTFTGGADRPNKPSETELYRHGNTQCDAAVYLPDDLADPVIVSESAQRIQVQYRIRVTGQTEAVNFQIQPDGFSNPNVLAQGGEAAPVADYFFVPADQATVSGNSDATAYNTTDPGLWVAGDGSSAAAADLQTLDGRVYAIPIGFVFRRNDAYLAGAGAGFDPINNTNGALPTTHALFSNPSVGSIVADTSDRPDKAFSDAIHENDFMDLRRHVTSLGHDLQSELQWQMHSLLDGEIRTWAIDAADKQTLGSGSGDVSTRFLVANEIGRDSGHGGNNSTSGDTPRGVTIRNFDHMARRFGDQPVIERVVFEVYPQDRAVGPVSAPGRINPGKYTEKSLSAPGDVGWFEGDKIHVDLTALNASTDGTFDPTTASLSAILENVLDFAPPGTVITDVLSVYHDDGNFSAAVNQEAQVTSVFGLGTGHVEITLDENPTLVSGGLAITAKAAGFVTLVGNPSPGDTVTVGGTVLTGVSGPPGVNQFRISGTTTDTSGNLAEAIAVWATGVDVQWEGATSTVHVIAEVAGAAGNSITLATSNPVDIVLSGATLTGGVDGVSPTPMVGSSSDSGSPRRLFVELEISYAKGNGLTDTPDYALTPDPANYSAGPVVENDPSQRPVDMEGLITPKYREGFREVGFEYVASENGAGTPIGGITTEQFVSRTPTEVVFLRRVYGSATELINVTDPNTAAPVAVDVTNTEFGSSSRKVVLGGSLSGAQALATVTYFAQDPLPNYGASGGGYQTTVYYRSNAPQTVGVKSGIMHGGGGPLPQELVVEPLLMSQKLWTGQTGVGSLDPSYPFALPLDQLPVNDGGLGGFPGEWYFCASSEVSIDDFNADTGLLHLPVLVPPAETATFSFGGVSNPPDKDIEFRAFYGFADDTAYRPTVMSQPLSGAVRHKVFTPFLARATEDTRLFRKDEVLLMVLTRWAELDGDNTVRFTDTDNRTCVGVYRTRSLLVLAGE